MPIDPAVGRPTAALADFVASTDFTDLPIGVVAHAKRVIADTVAVTIRGATAPEVKAFANHLIESGQGTAAVLRSGFPRTSTVKAAMANALASCTVELDEGSRPTGHPAIHVLPSVLGLGQEREVSGRELITAFVLGYEVQNRVQRACHLRKPIHCHGNLGNPAAAAAIGKILGWDGPKIAAAINAAATFASCTSYSLCYAGATVRNAAAAITAQNAFTVCDLVEAGVTGYEGSLREVFGHILGDHFQPEELTLALGERYGILENYIKFHGACGHVDAAIDALSVALGESLSPGHFPWRLKVDVQAEDIREIRVKMGHPAAELGRLPEVVPLSARFSIPFAIGAFLVRGCLDPDAFEGEALRDERVWRIARLVKVVGDEALDARYPAETAAELVIVLADGREIEGHSSNSYGNPMNQAEARDIESKFRWLLEDLIGADAVHDLWAWTSELDEFENMSTAFTWAVRTSA